MHLEKMSETHVAKCADLFIDAFTREPWKDEYSSAEQVVGYFRNCLKFDSFIGYVLKEGGETVSLCLGMKKQWINGTEYFIDQFCVKPGLQGQGIGSAFLKMIENSVRGQGMNAMILQTERGFPSERFYLKNGFEILEGLACFAKQI